MPINAAAIQAKINRGLGIGAARLGEDCELRRPTSPTVGPVPTTRQGTVTVWFTTDPKFASLTPGLYKKPTWYALCDRTDMQVGDYLFANGATYFIISAQPLLATAVVQCNATVTVFRGGAVSTLNEDQYAGRTVPTDTVLMQGFPASVLSIGRMEAGRTDLPGDPARKGVEVLLPFIAGATIRITDRLQVTYSQSGDLASNYTVDAAELTDLGWRLEGRVEL